MKFFSEFDLCYTLNMQDQSLWQKWAQRLRRLGLDQITAALLEAGGPFNFLLAQFFYASEPLLGGTMQEGEWNALAGVLEDSQSIHSFAALLRDRTDP